MQERKQQGHGTTPVAPRYPAQQVNSKDRFFRMMIQHLRIENMAIMDAVAVDFAPGWTAITGETGAGKSLLLEAISHVFGAKLSPKALLKAGTTRGSIELTLAVETSAPNWSAIAALLYEQGVEIDPTDDSLVLRREWTESTSRFRIQGVLVSREAMAQLRPWVIEAHQQHELLSLLTESTQRRWLDAFGDEGFRLLKSQVAQAYGAWQLAEKAHAEFMAQQATLAQQRLQDELAWEALDAAQLLDPDEDDKLSTLAKQLDARESLLHQSQRLLRCLDNDSTSPEEGLPGALHRLQNAAGIAEKLSRLSASNAEDANGPRQWANTLELLVEQCRALTHAIDSFSDDLTNAPQSLDTVMERLNTLDGLKRRFGQSLPELIATYDTLGERLSAMNDPVAHADQLQQAVTIAKTTFLTHATALHDARQAMATEKAQTITPLLQALHLPDCQFGIVLQDAPPSVDGIDRVQFTFQANPGQPSRPLADVASGGELARVMLVLKVLSADRLGASTLLFDEMDTGMSGPTLQQVAQHLAQLGQQRQVLCITHQPLIAARAPHHLHVQKGLTQSGELAVWVQALTEGNVASEARVAVLAKLTGGVQMGALGTDEATGEAAPAFATTFAEQLLAQL